MYLGGAHRSVLFPHTQATFLGVDREELTGRTAQVARFGVRVDAFAGTFVRLGTDVGGVRGSWRFPVEDPVVGWGVQAGLQTPIGPAWILWSGATDRGNGRLSVGVGRLF